MCAINNLNVPPMALKSNKCCTSIFVTEPCDRGHRPFCQAPHQPANYASRGGGIRGTFHLGIRAKAHHERYGTNDESKCTDAMKAGMNCSLYFNANSNSIASGYWTNITDYIAMKKTAPTMHLPLKSGYCILCFRKWVNSTPRKCKLDRLKLQCLKSLYCIMYFFWDNFIRKTIFMFRVFIYTPNSISWLRTSMLFTSANQIL